MSKTLFQKIMDGEIPGQIEYEDDQCIVLRDINPQAPTHLLIIPRKPIPGSEKLPKKINPLSDTSYLQVGELARMLSLENGFRIVINNGSDGGETVPHLHVHLLGGRALGWPPW